MGWDKMAKKGRARNGQFEKMKDNSANETLPFLPILSFSCSAFFPILSTPLIHFTLKNTSHNLKSTKGVFFWLSRTKFETNFKI